MVWGRNVLDRFPDILAFNNFNNRLSIAKLNQNQSRNFREIFGKSLHRTDRLVYRLLALYFVSFLSEISTRQLFTIANSNDGIYGRYTDVTLLELFAMRTHQFLFAFLYTHKLI